MPDMNGPSLTRLRTARRGLLRLGATGAFAAGAGVARAAGPLPDQQWGQGVGGAVANTTYGLPPKDESDMKRRLVPWLTGDQTSSMALPLQYQTGIMPVRCVFRALPQRHG